MKLPGDDVRIKQWWAPRQVPAYHSRYCELCSRDYLFPQYGSRYYCNDCIMTMEEEREQRRNERRARMQQHADDLRPDL